MPEHSAAQDRAGAHTARWASQQKQHPCGTAPKLASLLLALLLIAPVPLEPKGTVRLHRAAPHGAQNKCGVFGCIHEAGILLFCSQGVSAPVHVRNPQPSCTISETKEELFGVLLVENEGLQKH